ncbi:MAG: fatty acid hydroxylase [Alphaproteobacteria bacterium HGW-Alphaproteobacteria-18]|nr:MAG: fatty acid hydroxylase [Alphaproteobacteria bacterium HGW-Alphaproteobacteria-18]
MDTATLLRLSVFLGGLGLFAALEALFPRKARVMPRLHRWVTNLSLSALSSLGLRLLGPLTVAGAALAARQSGLGLFNMIDAPVWLAAAATLILLDLAVWAQHLAMHKSPLLWRMHRVHHTDRDLDVTSGLRFHPFEAAVSMAWKALIVFLLGAPLMVALAYEIILNAMSLFTHANLRLPLWLDRALRWVIVTPDMHRIHHSVIRTETDSNYGNALSIWDRIFATYTPEPAAGQDGLTIGLEEWQDARPAQIRFTLAHPLARK